jgi:hypothetical protein
MDAQPRTDAAAFSFPLHIDSTMLATFKACPRKFYYQFQRHLARDAKNIHLVAGSAFAAGLEAARRYLFRSDASNNRLDSEQSSDYLEAAFVAFSREWGTFDLKLDHTKSFINTFYALETYLHYHHPLLDPIQPIFANDAPQVEFSFAIPLPLCHPSGDQLLYCGRFDMLGVWESLPVIVDEKTTSALGESWRRQWDLRGQFLGYCWACQQLGIPVRTAVARGTAILKTKVNFLTVPVTFPQYLIDRWHEDMLYTIQMMLATYKNGYYSTNFGDSCNAYGGCAYSLLCQAKDPEEWIPYNYTERVWNPLSLRAREEDA